MGRSPFDLLEADSEIVAGYFIEYSGMKFALFFLAEYINLFAVSAVCTTLFLGGWKGPILPPYIWFLIKCYAIIFTLMWFRGTFPRFRIDQMLDLAWKVLVPLALVNLLLVGFVTQAFGQRSGVGDRPAAGQRDHARCRLAIPLDRDRAAYR